MPRCKYCGGPVNTKDNAGWWREFCMECAETIANGEDLTAKYDPDGDPE